jgi:hypothetical protein
MDVRKPPITTIIRNIHIHYIHIHHIRIHRPLVAPSDPNPKCFLLGSCEETVWLEKVSAQSSRIIISRQ